VLHSLGRGARLHGGAAAVAGVAATAHRLVGAAGLVGDQVQLAGAACLRSAYRWRMSATRRDICENAIGS
jgi:hypothetical protein